MPRGVQHIKSQVKADWNNGGETEGMRHTEEKPLWLSVICTQSEFKNLHSSYQSLGSELDLKCRDVTRLIWALGWGEWLNLNSCSWLINKSDFSWNKIFCRWELGVNEGIQYRIIFIKNLLDWKEGKFRFQRRVDLQRSFQNITFCHHTILKCFFFFIEAFVVETA